MQQLKRTHNLPDLPNRLKFNSIGQRYSSPETRKQYGMASEATQPSRRPYTGSCHCGAIKYIAYLTLPHTPTTERVNPDGTRPQRIYRCNCTTCQKAGIMHIRLPSASNDFLLLSPLDPMRELGDYQCFNKKIHFLFCRTCAVRCFSFMGEGELVEREVGNPPEKKTVWSPKQGWVEDMQKYMSVNAYTLDAGQEGLDLREWTEKKWIMYHDYLTEAKPGYDTSLERPFLGGAY